MSIFAKLVNRTLTIFQKTQKKKKKRINASQSLKCVLEAANGGSSIKEGVL